ncbi:glycosyl hydrolase [Rhypophila decipiens]|uniref:Glycosyl hydrolase n=1 Tax=Rhypophila decipiens TaxID=261697 RepID=A0AAN6YKP4_9PEZI|nr:glycosyl hydrolase [Rhypophila decipiens]
MNTAFYSPTDGRWSPNDAAWWVSGNAFQSLLDYMSKTGTRGSYTDQALQIFNTQRAPVPWWPQGGGEFRADSTDDTGWWALAMVRMFDLTGDQSYLNISMLDEAYISQYWSDSVCAGGVYVDIRALSYKNAIANQLYVQLCAALHNRIPGDTVYLERAVTGWGWLRASGMVNDDGLFNDGLAMREDNTCFNNGLPVWTYNQGVILGAAAELYRATKDTSYLTFARQIADSVLSSKSLIQNDGILTESCETDDHPTGCNGDQQIFKGIFARNLADLDSLVEGRPYRSFLEANARRAYSNDRAGGGGSDLYDVSWAGPYVASSLAKQASVLSLWVALI